MMASLPVIPEGLAEYADKIRGSARDALRVKLKPAKDLTPWQSKVGGIPYMPATADYPKGPAGDPLKLLAQLNLSEIPRLQELPETGILQFYIDPFDEFLGNVGNTIDMSLVLARKTTYNFHNYSTKIPTHIISDSGMLRVYGEHLEKD